jgi:uncharacterized Ntn-hydrolase superfamily protein
MTFSIAARCARTGMFGIVVTTSSLAVGSRCAHAKAGIGAALTQHVTDPRLGPLGIELMERGFTARQAIDAVVAATPHRDWRQLAFIDRDGGTASFSGTRVKPERGETHGRDCVALGNIVRSAEVPVAMVRAFEADPGLALASRLIGALEAGDSAGGEFRPLVSAALLVVDRQSFPYVDLRVDSDPTPIAALAKLWRDYAPLAENFVARATDPDAVMIPAIVPA